MATQKFTVILTWDEQEQLWVTHVPALNWISTYGHTQEEALAMTEEAILGYLEAAEKDGVAVPATSTEARLLEVEVAR
ncbi:MAG: type II toxin-antitoxin system HicB family antitoxin [Chloroflexi bacterium]|nr:type II toxin-antitoxin system HicB family antitoxin [Chloroflexota bacterium]